MLRFFIFVICFILTGIAHSSEPVKIAVIPFKINAEKDLTFLKDGVFEMLSSRLTREDKVTVIAKEDIEKTLGNFKGILNESKAREIGSQLEADYVLFGSLTLFGDSVSIDAKMADISGKISPLVLFDQSRDMGEVIPKINRFAEEINAKIFGIEPASSSPQSAPQSAEKKEKVQRPVEELDSRAHPEKLYRKETGMTVKSDSVDKGEPGSAFVKVEEDGQASGAFWKSRYFKDHLNGIALGDVDGDGKIETVIIGSHEILVNRVENDQLYKVKEIKESRYINLIGVDVADINGNGYAEIFVTSLNAYRNSVNSFVLEWNGADFNKIVEDRSWYYRVSTIPGKGDILLGQKHKAGSPFYGEVVELVWQNSDYLPKDTLILSTRNNLLGLAFGDVMNNGQNCAAAYNSTDHIQVIDKSGDVLWKGNERYGGTNLYYVLPAAEVGEENRQYLPMRLQVLDIDSDGKNEVIAVKNYEMAGRMLEKFRKFTDTQIQVFGWDGLGLTKEWETKKTSGYITDFDIGDFDNDGTLELAAIVVVKEGFIIGTTPSSVMIAYDLKQ